MLCKMCPPCFPPRASPWVHHSFTWCNGMSLNSPSDRSLTLMGIHHQRHGYDEARITEICVGTRACEQAVVCNGGLHPLCTRAWFRHLCRGAICFLMCGILLGGVLSYDESQRYVEGYGTPSEHKKSEGNYFPLMWFKWDKMGFGGIGESVFACKRKNQARSRAK